MGTSIFQKEVIESGQGEGGIGVSPANGSADNVNESKEMVDSLPGDLPHITRGTNEAALKNMIQKANMRKTNYSGDKNISAEQEAQNESVVDEVIGLSFPDSVPYAGYVLERIVGIVQEKGTPSPWPDINGNIDLPKGSH